MKQRRKLIRTRRTRVGLLLVAALAVLAGMTDVIGFLMTGDFISFMSGNTTQAAATFGLGHTAQTLHLLLVLVIFVAGNALGVIFAYHTGRRPFPLLLLVAALLAIAAGLPGVRYATVAFLCAVLAMGLINSIVEQVEGRSVGVTYVTGALSRLGRSLGRLAIGEGLGDWTPHAIPWAGMFMGALIGAPLQQHLGRAALWVVCALTFALAFASLRIPRPWQRRYIPVPKTTLRRIEREIEAPPKSE